MELYYCRRCGTRLTRQGEPYVCENSHHLFDSPNPAVGIFLLNDSDEVLLAVRGIEPGKGLLDTPGGFIDINESIEQALEREIQEELALSPDQYETPEYLCSGYSDYFYENEHRPILSAIYTSRLKPGAIPEAHDDVESVRFIPIDQVDVDSISSNDVKEALSLLRQKVLGN